MTSLSTPSTFVLQTPIIDSSSDYRSFDFINPSFSFFANNKSSIISRPCTVVTAIPMASGDSSAKSVNCVPDSSIKLLFVEMGVGYDQHGQDITSAAMRACRDAISSNSIPAFRREPEQLLRRCYTLFTSQGSIPGVSFGEMKLQIKLGVPRPLQHLLDLDKVKSVFPYGAITSVEVVDGGLICSSGVHVEEMGDKNDDCYIVNAAVYVGY